MPQADCQGTYGVVWFFCLLLPSSTNFSLSSPLLLSFILPSYPWFLSHPLILILVPRSCGFFSLPSPFCYNFLPPSSDPLFLSFWPVLPFPSSVCLMVEETYSFLFLCPHSVSYLPHRIWSLHRLPTFSLTQAVTGFLVLSFHRSPLLSSVAIILPSCSTMFSSTNSFSLALPCLHS